jgi:hypothetical protein
MSFDGSMLPLPNQTFVQSCIAIQELAKIDPAVAVMVDIQNTLINTAFRKYASPHLQAKYVFNDYLNLRLFCHRIFCVFCFVVSCCIV